MSVFILQKYEPVSKSQLKKVTKLYHQDVRKAEKARLQEVSQHLTFTTLKYARTNHEDHVLPCTLKGRYTVLESVEKGSDR